MVEKIGGEAMKKKYHLHGGPEEIKWVIQNFEKTDPALAEILKRHINPKTGVPLATDTKEKKLAPPAFPPPTKEGLRDAEIHEINLTRNIPESDR